MDARELRIGNLVYHLMRNYLDQRKEWLEPTIIDCEDLETIDQRFQPIPLTEEWLLRFGFFMVNKSYFEHSKSRFFLEYTKDLNGDWYIMINDSPRIYLEHVHQLQNLYFALTGEELTLKN